MCRGKVYDHFVKAQWMEPGQKTTRKCGANTPVSECKHTDTTEQGKFAVNQYIQPFFKCGPKRQKEIGKGQENRKILWEKQVGKDKKANREPIKGLKCHIKQLQSQRNQHQGSKHNQRRFPVQLQEFRASKRQK